MKHTTSDSTNPVNKLLVHNFIPPFNKSLMNTKLSTAGYLLTKYLHFLYFNIWIQKVET
jgi:hypothetical protein